MNDDTGTMPDQDVTTDTAGTTDAPSEAAQEAARIRQEAAARREAGTLLAEATRLSQEAAEEADRVLVSAQDTAERLVEEARERAEALVTQARQESQELRDEAALEVAGAREDLEQQRTRAREEVTAELREEVAALRARTESLVEELRSTLGELGGLLGGAKSTVEHVLRTASDLDEVGRRIAAHDQRTAAAQPTAAGAPVEAPSVPDRSEDRDDRDDRGEVPAVTPAQTPRAMEAVQLVGDQSTSEHTPAVVADGTSPEPVSTAGSVDADDFSPRFDIDLGDSPSDLTRDLGGDPGGELVEPQETPRTTVEQEQRPLGWLFRGV